MYVIRLQNHDMGQKPLVLHEKKGVSLLVHTAKIPAEDCQEKLCVVLVMTDGFKL